MNPICVDRGRRRLLVSLDIILATSYFLSSFTVRSAEGTRGRGGRRKEASMARLLSCCTALQHRCPLEHGKKTRIRVGSKTLKNVHLSRDGRTLYRWPHSEFSRVFFNILSAKTLPICAIPRVPF